MVVGEGVNFRTEPNTNSTPSGKLINGELLLFKEIVPGIKNRLWITIDESWLKVQRVSTGEIGFVFGKYVRTQEAINPDIKLIQIGNWYNIFKKDLGVTVKKSKPVLQVNVDGDTTIITNHEGYWISICSQSGLNEGNVEGHIYSDNEGNLSIGKQEVLLRNQKYQFNLVCTGEVELDRFMGFTRTDERIYFITEVFNGSQTSYSKQDLTDCILKFGETGYHLNFAGDLNGDGIPEIIFSEATTREGVTYYFVSNKEGKLELKSISYGYDKC
jgi:hypothetical protein